MFFGKKKAKEEEEEAGEEAPVDTSDVERGLEEAKKDLAIEALSQQVKDLSKTVKNLTNPPKKIAPDTIATWGENKQYIDEAISANVKISESPEKTILQKVKADPKYPDFDEIVTKETVYSLTQEHPKIANEISSLNDNPVRMAKETYNAIKKLNIAKTKTDKETDEISEKAREKKSNSPHAAHSSHLGSAFALSKTYQNDLLTEMRQCGKLAN